MTSTLWHIKKKGKKSTAARVALDGILAALALTLAFFEGLIPATPFLPPGAKLGLANIAVMFAVLSVGYADAIFLTLIKSGFVFLTRGASSFFMSISGGALSMVAMILIVAISRKIKKDFSYIGISVICAVIHNIGQTVAASIYTGTNLFTAYLPLLIITGILSGIITGIVLKTVMPILLKINFKGLKE